MHDNTRAFERTPVHYYPYVERSVGAGKASWKRSHRRACPCRQAFEASKSLVREQRTKPDAAGQRCVIDLGSARDAGEARERSPRPELVHEHRLGVRSLRSPVGSKTPNLWNDSLHDERLREAEAAHEEVAGVL